LCSDEKGRATGPFLHARNVLVKRLTSSERILEAVSRSLCDFHDERPDQDIGIGMRQWMIYKGNARIALHGMLQNAGLSRRDVMRISKLLKRRPGHQHSPMARTTKMLDGLAQMMPPTIGRTRGLR